MRVQPSQISSGQVSLIWGMEGILHQVSPQIIVTEASNGGARYLPCKVCLDCLRRVSLEHEHLLSQALTG